MQILASIELNNISRDDEGFLIKITKHIKTSAPNRAQPTLILPHFKENSKVCIAETIDTYLKVVSSLRNAVSFDLVSFYISVKNIARLFRLG